MGKIKELLKKLRNHMYMNFITDKIIPMKNQIILQSNPEFSDNTFALYKEMIKRDLQKKYKIIWFTTKDKFLLNQTNIRDDVYYFNENKKGIFSFIKKHYLINTSKFIITCNGYYHRKTNRQTIVYLNHGMPIKDCTGLKMKFGDCDISLATSKFFVEHLSESLYTSKDKFKIFQFPRNDDLLTCNKDVKKILGIGNKKLVVWLPTFRKHADGVRVDSSFDMPLGVPIIYDIDSMKKLNKYLKDNNIYLLLKPHFAAKVDELKAGELSNFRIIYNDDLDNMDITLYDLLSKSDALVTDYSSVYYDYLILNKPIALTIDDIKEYKEGFGFAFEYKDACKGHYVENIADFYKFFDNLANNKDEFKREREKVIKMLKYDVSGDFSKKLLDYLVDKYYL